MCQLIPSIAPIKSAAGSDHMAVATARQNFSHDAGFNEKLDKADEKVAAQETFKEAQKNVKDAERSLGIKKQESYQKSKLKESKTLSVN